MTANSIAMHPMIAALRQIVPGLARVLGDGAEVVLHELSHPQDSVVAIAGNVTGRKVGAPLTDLVLRLMRAGQVGDDLINYPSRSADGKVLRSSTIFIRDEQGELIGCLCINFDITKWMIAKHVIEGYCHTTPLGGGAQETFIQDVEVMLRSNIQEVIEQGGIPVSMMKKEDKLRVVKSLDERGIFLIKGAVENVAKFLDVSRYTIYNYLDEIRSQKSEELMINLKGEVHG